MRLPVRLRVDRLPLAVLATACALLAATTPLFPFERAGAPGGEPVARRFDAGVTIADDVVAAAPEDVRGTPIALAVALIGDCEPGEAPPVCGAPAAQWASGQRAVEFCSYPQHRPGWLSEDALQRTLRAAADAWAGAEAGIGVRYTGTCTGGSGWQARNGRNEVAFDDSRNIVQGNTAAVASVHLSWFPAQQPTQRRIEEADIVFDEAFPQSVQCLLATAIHEFGHALGFGHSDDRADVMYPSFSVQVAGSCKEVPSAAERTALQALYGVDRAPAVRVAMTTEPGGELALLAEASDPEGGALRFEWLQTAGPALVLSAEGPRARVASPGAAAAELQVSVRDPLGHLAVARVTLPAANAPVPASSGALVPQASALLSGGPPVGGVGGATTTEELVAALGCPSGPTLWAAAGGQLVPFVAGAGVQAVNAGWHELFPGGRLPAGTPLLVSCA
jgi:hypothetical protein